MIRKIAPSIAAVLILIIGMLSSADAQVEQNQTQGVEGEREGAQAKIIPISIKVEIASETCDSDIDITYEQRNTIARVEGSIASSACPASKGEYTLVVGFTGEDDEYKTLDFVEIWQRSDDLAISFVHDYEIGENVDLTRIRMRNFRCSCTELPEE